MRFLGGRSLISLDSLQLQNDSSTSKTTTYLMGCIVQSKRGLFSIDHPNYHEN